MEIDILDIIRRIIGYLSGFALIGAFLASIVYWVFNSLRSFIKKTDVSVKTNLKRIADVELFTIIVLSYLATGYLIWQNTTFNLFVEIYCGYIFTITAPFWLLYFLPKRTMEITIKILLSVFLLVCLLKLKSSNFEDLKYFFLFGFSLLAYYNYERNSKIELVVFVALAFLYQPFFKIILKREVWVFLDIIISIGLIASLPFKSKNREIPDRQINQSHNTDKS